MSKDSNGRRKESRRAESRTAILIRRIRHVVGKSGAHVDGHNQAPDQFNMPTAAAEGERQGLRAQRHDEISVSDTLQRAKVSLRFCEAWRGDTQNVTPAWFDLRRYVK